MTFTGKVRASTSIASILVAVVGSGTWAVTYILNFILPENLQSPYWGLLTFLSVLIVPWYWKQAARTEEVRLMIEEEDGVSTVFVKGHRDELLDMEGAFQWKRNEPVYEGDEKAKQPETASTN